jgi:pSer/pThr/pTyr-binding forkhead associated (FHA) protein
MDVLLLVLRVLLAITLYAFLAIVLLMLWRDLRQTDADQSPRSVGKLVIVQTGTESLTEGDVFPLQPVTSIGRSPSNTICIPDTYTSAQHALLAWREGQWWLEDRESRNGTMLNGVPVGSPTVVSAGDVIDIGRTQLKLELE